MHAERHANCNPLARSQLQAQLQAQSHPESEPSLFYMRMTALLASRSDDVIRPAAQPLLQVATSGWAPAPAPLVAAFLAALRCASSSRSHLHIFDQLRSLT